MKKGIISSILLASIFVAGSALSANPQAVVGKYLTQDKDSIVQVFKCGAKFCGRIVWLKTPNDKAGKPKVDSNNPNAKYKTRKIHGMNLVGGFSHAGGNICENGNIYNPKDGKTYSCKMTLNGNKLSVRGYVGIAALGKTVVWTKTG